MKRFLTLGIAAVAGMSGAGGQFASSMGDGCVRGQGALRVVASAPKDCCSGRMACAQYLSTATVVHRAAQQHS